MVSIPTAFVTLPGGSKSRLRPVELEKLKALLQAKIERMDGRGFCSGGTTRRSPIGIWFAHRPSVSHRAGDRETRKWTLVITPAVGQIHRMKQEFVFQADQDEDMFVATRHGAKGHR
jgi:hypothetical protein